MLTGHVSIGLVFTQHSQLHHNHGGPGALGDQHLTTMADAATASVSSTTPDVGRRYTYDSPEPYSFVRLLRLTSPVGASRIEGRLTTVLLPGPFTAISYTWGRGDTVERLWLGNGRYVPINESAGYVLRHMPRGGQIWIDSVCIDQENEAEKEWTIPNVHQVYMAAQQVNVWLGPPSEESEAAFGLLRAINDNVILSDELAELFAKAPPGSHIDEMVQLHRALGDSWVALADLLDSPWFTRCWVSSAPAVGRSGAVFQPCIDNMA